jgi:DNA adenine methylase
MNTAPSAPKRPLLRYHGGKWELAPWIISHFPAHRVYVEPYGGAASVLLRKPRSYAEIYNDLDGEIVNLFRVLRDPMQARELVRLVALTPYARAEFELSYLPDGDPVEQARRTVVRSFMGYHAEATTGQPAGFRTGVRGDKPSAANDWAHIDLGAAIGRLRGVTIENRPALRVIRAYDRPEALFYLDPPYPAGVRGTDGFYRHEMTDGEHRELAELANSVKGMVIISGYRCPLYDELYADWRCVTKYCYADSAAPRQEALWLSPRLANDATLLLF